MKKIKQWVVGFSLFLAALAGTAQAHVPTLGSTNVWTGSNTFNSIHLPALRQCTSPQVMAGFDANFNPICVTGGGGGGAVASVNGLTGAISIGNTDGNLSISTPNSSTIQINCANCGGGTGTPAGGNGAFQTNQSGSFSGTVINGLVFGLGSSNPRAGVADVDFALPFALTCSGGISCPKTGENYTFTATGSAGTGSVATANFGQVGGYLAQGTTISGAPAVYSVSPSWSLAQINALFSRFNLVNISNCSITSNVATLTGNNSYTPGDTVVFGGFTYCTGLNGYTLTVLSAGLSQTQFEVTTSSGNVSSVAESAAYSYVLGAAANGTVIIPPGVVDGPATAWNNVNAQVWDTRKGYGFQQLTQYGAKCDLTTPYMTIVAGQNYANVGAELSSANIGQTIALGSQNGYGNMGTQQDWEATITSFTYPYVYFSANAPFNYTGFVETGTNNQAAIQRAFNALGGSIPLWIPQCTMLTDTIRWNGQNLLGTSMTYSGFRGIPGHDILQGQDSTPITAWSINTSTGVTTFTIPSYSAHHILATSDYPAGSGILGDSIKLESFPTSTFFNNQVVTIATHPTPTTFTVASVFGQSTSSATEAGVAGATTSINNSGMREENYTLHVNNAIDPSFVWNHYDAGANLTVEPAYYRPLEEQSPVANNPFAPGWGVGQVNGIANITQNSAVICISTTVVGGNTPRIPGIGTTIVFPYQGVGLFSATVSSTAGSCSGAFTPITLSAALPNNAAFTATQAEWFTFTTPQALAVAIPASITLPYTITLTTPFPPVPGWESNVSSHGHVIIGADEWDYMGDNFGGTAGGSPTITLRNGPKANCVVSTGVCSVNGGAGDAINSIVFPLNPCQAFYNVPYPVIPTLNTGAATPIHAVFYPGLCGGNAGMSMPGVDGTTTQFNSNSPDIAHFVDVQGTYTDSNALGNQDNNGAMFIYEQANNTGYGNTFDDLRASGLWGGFMQGPASVNQFYVATIGPTSTGQTFNNCTFRTGYSFSLVNMVQSKINRCDTYSSETSPYDGTVVGASTDLHFGYTAGETTGGYITGTGQLTIEDYNGEPENGNHFEYPPAVVSDANNVTWSGSIFEGGYNIFGGSYQIIHGTQMAVPVFNYGNNNYFEHLYGLETTVYDSNVYNGTSQFYNWGQNSTCEATIGGGGPLRTCGVGFVQSYNGHDAWSTMMGNNSHPTENILGGMILPGELSSSFGETTTFDSTELWWGQYSSCAIGVGLECVGTEFDSFNGYIFIGPHQRIADAPAVMKANVKLQNTGTATFRFLVAAETPGSGCSANYGLATGTFSATSTGWTPVQLPIDFTGKAGCTFALQADSGSATNVLEIGYVNIVPFPGQMYMPLATHTVGASCPVAGEFSVDATNFWVCKPSSGVAFGTGTWDYYGTAH